MRRFLRYLAFLAFFALLFSSCGQKEITVDQAAFVINNGAEPQTLDPSHIQGNVEHRLYTALFEGLVTYDPKTSRALPGIAESWSFSEGGTVLTFKLRKAQWSDGVPLTAKDFVGGWLRTLAPETGAEYAYLIGTVVKGAEEYNGGTGKAEDVGIKALDDRTFQVSLKGPVPYAVDMMAHYAFAGLPMHAIEKYGDEWIKPANWVGDGPFVLKEWKPQEYIFVAKNPKYWDARNVKLESLKFLPIEDLRTSYNMFKNGEIDWDPHVLNEVLDEVKLRRDYQVGPQFSTYYYIFNTTRKPLDDVRVRKALAMSIDKKGLVDKVTKAGQIPADALVAPMEGYTPATGNPFNVEEAKQLLAAAGYPNGQGFPKLTVIYNTSDNHKRTAEYVQAEWKRNLGIDVALQNQEWKTFLDTRSNSHDFDISRAGWIADYVDPSTYLDMFLSTSGNNDGLYSNPRYDELCKKAVTMAAGPERNAVLGQAENIFITEDQGIIPFYYYVAQNMIDLDTWGGWFTNPLDVHEWKYIYRK